MSKIIVAKQGHDKSPTSVSTKRKTSSTKGNEWLILSSILGGKPYDEIATELGIKVEVLRSFVTKTTKALYQTIETRALLECQALDKMGKKYHWAPTRALDSQVNNAFVKKLSGPDDAILTEEELNFCYLLVYEGNAKAALKDSGLDIGLSKSLGAAEYNRLLELRCTYLKSKPNLIDYLRELQVKFVDTLSVSKTSIQAELMRTITQLRNQDDPKNAPTIAKLLNDLGRTEGIFIDKQEVATQLSLDDSFGLLEARRREVVQLPEPMSTYVDPSILEAEYQESTL